MDAVTQPLLDQDIILMQDFRTDERGCVCQTLLLHESGETITFYSPSITPQRADPQGWASASTYARRYGLMAAMGIVGDPDDDGNKATEQYKMPEARAKEIAALLEAANPETNEGVHAFAEAWIEMNSDEQRSFGPWFSKFYPGEVSANKQHMRDVLQAYRDGANGE